MLNFTTICSVGVALFYANGLTDGQMDRRAYMARLKRSLFAAALQTHLKIKIVGVYAIKAFEGSRGI